MNNARLTQSYQVLLYDEIEDYEQTIADLSAHLQADPANAHACNNGSREMLGVTAKLR
jgi:hypothetical protein